MLNIPVRYFEEKVEDFLAKEVVGARELGEISIICEIVISYHNYFSSSLIAKVDRINNPWFASESEVIEDQSEVQSEDIEEPVEDESEDLKKN